MTPRSRSARSRALQVDSAMPARRASSGVGIRPSACARRRWRGRRRPGSGAGRSSAAASAEPSVARGWCRHTCGSHGLAGLRKVFCPAPRLPQDHRPLPVWRPPSLTPLRHGARRSRPFPAGRTSRRSTCCQHVPPMASIEGGGAAYGPWRSEAARPERPLLVYQRLWNPQCRPFGKASPSSSSCAGRSPSPPGYGAVSLDPCSPRSAAGRPHVVAVRPLWHGGTDHLLATGLLPGARSLGAAGPISDASCGGHPVWSSSETPGQRSLDLVDIIAAVAAAGDARARRQHLRHAGPPAAGLVRRDPVVLHSATKVHRRSRRPPLGSVVATTRGGLPG